MGGGSKPTRRGGGNRVGGANKELGLVKVPPMLNDPYTSTRTMATEILWYAAGPTVITWVPPVAAVVPVRLNQLASALLSALQASWEEFIIRAVDFEIINLGTGPAGTGFGAMKFYVDETDTTAPTATTSISHVGKVLNFANLAKDRVHIRWTAANSADLQWFNINSASTTNIVCCLKAYTDATLWGASGSGGGFLVAPSYCVQLRNQGGA